MFALRSYVGDNLAVIILFVMLVVVLTQCSAMSDVRLCLGAKVARIAYHACVATSFT